MVMLRCYGKAVFFFFCLRLDVIKFVATNLGSHVVDVSPDTVLMLSKLTSFLFVAFRRSVWWPC